MKIKFSIAVAALALCACQPVRHSPHMYRLDSGQIAYQSNDVWYYMWLSQANSSAPAGTVTNVWVKGSAPSSSTLKNAEELDENEAHAIEEVDALPEEVAAENESNDQANSESESESNSDSSGGDSSASDSGGDSGGGGDGGGGGGE